MTVVSGIVIGCLALCVVLVVAAIAGGGKGAAAAPTPGPRTAPGDDAPRPGTPSPPSGGIPIARGPSGPCPALTSGPTGVPGYEPSELEWESYRGLAMPFSRSAGPKGGAGSVSRCFAHTPTGALLAATHISARALLAPDWRPIAENQFVPGPATDAFVTRMTSLVGDPTPGLVRDVTGIMQPAGFKFLGYTPEQAVVALLFASEAQARMQSAVYTVVWGGDDWLLQAQPDGTLGTMRQRPTSLDGFVPWGKE